MLCQGLNHQSDWYTVPQTVLCKTKKEGATMQTTRIKIYCEVQTSSHLGKLFNNASKVNLQQSHLFEVHGITGFVQIGF